MRIDNLRPLLAVALLACLPPAAAGDAARQSPPKTWGHPHVASPKSPAAFRGTLTDIQGNTITLRGAGGVERQFQVSSTKGLQKGATALCEEDCERTLRVGDTVVRVQRGR